MVVVNEWHSFTITMMHRFHAQSLYVCWCEKARHTVGAVALVAQNGTVEVALKGAFSFTGRLFCYSQPVHCLRKEFEWSLLSVHAKSHFYCLEPNLWCVWLLYSWLFVGWKDIGNLKCHRAVKCTVFDISSFRFFRCQHAEMELFVSCLLVGIYGLRRCFYRYKVYAIEMQIQFRKMWCEQADVMFYYDIRLTRIHNNVTFSTWW